MSECDHDDDDGYDACPEPTCSLYGKAVMVDRDEFPCPDDEHVAIDEDGFCRGCGEQV